MREAGPWKKRSNRRSQEGIEGYFTRIRQSLKNLMDLVGSLPIEIAQEIFKYLGATDLSNCCRVNKQWRNCANSDHLWKKICMREGIVCREDYYAQESPLDSMVDWAHAYADFVKRRFVNWRNDRKTVTVVNSGYGTAACCDGETLVFTNSSHMLFVYCMMRQKLHCVQTIVHEDRETDITGIDLVDTSLIVRQGDAFAIYERQLPPSRKFTLKGYLLRVGDAYVFARGFHDTDHGCSLVKYAVISGGICIAVGQSLFVVNVVKTDIREVSVFGISFVLHDHFRAYVASDEKTVTGVDVNLSFEDFYLPSDSVIAMKSNKQSIVGLISSKNSYFFYIWDLRQGYLPKKILTHRPFGFEVHSKMNRLAAVVLDKFNSRTLVSIYDFDYDVNYEIEINDDAIAQAKLCFIGRDLLYCATRPDWDIYDVAYVIDTKNMKLLYDDDIGPTNIVSIDSKHAVYSHGDVLEIHTFI